MRGQKKRPHFMPIAMSVALALVYLAAANFDPTVHSIHDIEAAMRSVKSYRITVKYDRSNELGYNDPKAKTATSFIKVRTQVGTNPIISSSYQVYVDVINHRAEQSSFNNFFDQVIIGSELYTNQDGAWSKSNHGDAAFKEVTGIVIRKYDHQSDAVFKQVANQVVDGVNCRVYTYSYQPKNMLQPSWDSTYWVDSDKLPRKVRHYYRYEGGFNTSTAFIDRINEPVTIDLSIIK